ncbi:MAG: hypothetical protein ACI4SB_08570, partial [Acutalibacteraceae bacterium]
MTKLLFVAIHTKAAVCGEAAHLPLPVATAKQNRKVLSAAVRPSDETCPKPPDLPSLIIYKLSSAEKPTLRRISFPLAQ